MSLLFLLTSSCDQASNCNDFEKLFHISSKVIEKKLFSQREIFRKEKMKELDEEIKYLYHLFVT